MTILQAYCDESETHASGRRVLSVAGGLSTVAGWEAFEPRWKAALAPYDLTHFHMTDFENRRGDYDGWDTKRRLALIQSLIDAIAAARPRIMAFACALVLDDYEALGESDRQRLGEPYEFCALWAIRLVGNFLNIEGAKGLVHYTFEKRHGSGKLGAAFQKAFNTVADERRLAGIAFVRKGVLAPLDVADFTAYESSKDVLRSIGADSRPTRRSLSALLGGVYAKGYIFDAPTLRRVLDSNLGPLHESDLRSKADYRSSAESGVPRGDSDATSG